MFHPDFTTDHICHEDISRGHCCTGSSLLPEVRGFLLPAGEVVVGYFHTPHCDALVLSRNLDHTSSNFLRPTAMHRFHLEVGGLLLPAGWGREGGYSGASWQDLRLKTLLSSVVLDFC